MAGDEQRYVSSRDATQVGSTCPAGSALSMLAFKFLSGDFSLTVAATQDRICGSQRGATFDCSRTEQARGAVTLIYMNLHADLFYE